MNGVVVGEKTISKRATNQLYRRLIGRKGRRAGQGVDCHTRVHRRRTTSDPRSALAPFAELKLLTPGIACSSRGCRIWSPSDRHVGRRGHHELAASVRERGARVVFGRSLPYRESGVYGALATHVMGLCGIFESDAPDVFADKLRARTRALLDGSSVAATVAEHLGAIVGIDGWGTEATDRDMLFSSTRLFVEAAAREQPTILVFEDVHWSGSSLLDLIDALAVGSHGLPLLLVTLARPELLDTRAGWGGRLSSYTSLTLGPLDEANSRELAVRRLGAPERADAVVKIARETRSSREQLAATMEETEVRCRRASAA